MKKDPPNGALQNSNFLSWPREMVVHKFSTSSFEATFFKIPLHSCYISYTSERCFSSAGLTASELRTQLSGEHLKPLNVMHCNKVLP